MAELKRTLFSEYKGFADKRIKNLAKSSRFIVDDRSPRDIGADRGLLGYFCAIFADVRSDHEVSVELCGNIPIAPAVRQWITRHEADVGSRNGDINSLSFPVRRGEESRLLELADAITSIVAPGAPRYSERSYKYVCPRTATSVRRLARVLARAWA